MSNLPMAIAGAVIGATIVTVTLIISGILSVGMSVMSGMFGFAISMVLYMFLEIWFDRKYPL